MKLIRFVGNGDGVVDTPVLHLSGALGADYTLCGLSLDGDPETVGDTEFVDASTVTCPDCAAVIAHCRGVRFKTPNA